MEKFNGVSYIPQLLWHEPDVTFSTVTVFGVAEAFAGRNTFMRVIRRN